jgi:hypothetical protein
VLDVFGFRPLGCQIIYQIGLDISTLIAASGCVQELTALLVVVLAMAIMHKNSGDLFYMIELDAY